MRARTFFLGCTVALWTSVAAAQPVPGTAAPSPSADEADRLFREANKLYNEKKYAEAESLYEQAFAQKRAHDIAANLGYAEMKQGKLVEAAEHLAFAVRSWPPTGKEENRRSAKEQLAKVKAEVVTFTIDVNVTDAQVLINERDIGRSPLEGEAFAPAGRVVVRAKRAGYVDAETIVETAPKGSAHGVKLVLTPAPAAAPAVPTVMATASATAVVPPAPPRSMVPAYVMGGVGLASLIAGGVLVGAGFAKRSDVLAQEPKDADGKPVCYQLPPPSGPDTDARCASLRATAAEGTTLANAGVVMFGVGGAAAAASVVYALWARSGGPASPPKAAARLVPVVSTESAGLVWIGAF